MSNPVLDSLKTVEEKADYVCWDLGLHASDVSEDNYDEFVNKCEELGLNFQEIWSIILAHKN